MGRLIDIAVVRVLHFRDHHRRILRVPRPHQSERKGQESGKGLLLFWTSNSDKLSAMREWEQSRLHRFYRWWRLTERFEGRFCQKKNGSRVSVNMHRREVMHGLTLPLDHWVLVLPSVKFHSLCNCQFHTITANPNLQMTCAIRGGATGAHEQKSPNLNETVCSYSIIRIKSLLFQNISLVEVSYQSTMISRIWTAENTSANFCSA